MLSFAALFPFLHTIDVPFRPGRMEDFARRISLSRQYFRKQTKRFKSTHNNYDLGPPPFGQLRNIQLVCSEDPGRCLPSLGVVVDERSSIQHLVLEGLEARRRDKNWLERSTRKQLQTIELVNTPASIETLEIVFKGAKELQTFQYQIRDFDDTAPDWSYWDVVVEVMRETFVNSLTKLSLTCVNPLSTQSLTMRPLPGLGAFENIRYFHTQASLLIHDRESNLSKSTKTIYFQASVAPKDRSIQVTRLNAILPPSVKRVRLDMFELMEISSRMFVGLDETVKFPYLDEFELSWRPVTADLDRRIAKILRARNATWRCP
ncbi:MAG: hypothetical protein Q9162_002456 [Coniocarpon cinnabarinum]